MDFSLPSELLLFWNFVCVCFRWQYNILILSVINYHLINFNEILIPYEIVPSSSEIEKKFNLEIFRRISIIFQFSNILNVINFK